MLYYIFGLMNTCSLPVNSLKQIQKQLLFIYLFKKYGLLLRQRIHEETFYFKTKTNIKKKI